MANLGHFWLDFHALSDAIEFGRRNRPEGGRKSKKSSETRSLVVKERPKKITSL